MAITLDPTSLTEDPTPTANDYQRGPASGIPQSDVVPEGFMGGTFGPSPWEEEDPEEAAYQEATRKWYQEGMKNLERGFEDPEKEFKDSDFGIGRDPAAMRREVLVAGWMDLHLDEPRAPDELQRRVQIQRASLGVFGQMVDSTEDLYPLIEKDMIKRKDSAALHQQLAAAAFDDALLPSDGRKGYTAFREKLKEMPGYDPEKEGDYIEAWHEVRRAGMERVAPFREELVSAWRAFRLGEEPNVEIYDSLSDEEFPEFLAALRLRAQTLPDNEREGFLAGMAIKLSRALEDPVRHSVDTASGIAFRLDPRTATPAAGLGGSVAGIPMEEQQAMGDQRVMRRNRAHEVRRILREDYNPITDLGGVLGTIQAIPGTTLQSMTMAVPVLGQAHMAGFLTGAAQESSYLRMRDAGLSEAEAAGISSAIAPAVALPQFVLEKLQYGIWANKVPGLSPLLKTVGDKVANRALRFGLNTGMITVLEGTVEVAQDFTEMVVQDIAGVLNPLVPDVDLFDEFKGAWANFPQIAGEMIVLSMIGASGRMGRDARAREIAQADPLRLQALGLTPEAIIEIEAAKEKGQSSLNGAVDAAWESRDPNSEQAKAAVQQLVAEAAAKAAAQQQLEGENLLPILVRSGEGWAVLDPATRQEVGRAPDMAGAMRISREHFSEMEDMTAEEIAYLGTMMEAGDTVAGRDNDQRQTTQEFRLGELRTVALAMAEDPKALERYQKQIALKEVMETGSDTFARTILGDNKTSIGQKLRTTVNRLFRGAAVTDVFHEEFHGIRREAHAAGRITRADEVKLLRALDRVLEGKRVRKDGTQLRFIPEGITQEMLESGVIPQELLPENFNGTSQQYAETLIDEAISEIAEMEILRSRKRDARAGKAPIKASAGMISRNLTALAKILAPEALQKWTAFLGAIRARFGLALSRAHALKKAERDGLFDAVGYEAFLHKLLGTDQQAEFDGQVAEMADELVGAGDPFSLGKEMMDAGWRQGFHAGTIQDVYDPTKADMDAQYGPGFYVSESAQRAEGYGKNKARKFLIKTSNPFDHDARIDRSEAERIVATVGKDSTFLEDLYQDEQESGTPVIGEDVWNLLKDEISPMIAQDALQLAGYDSATYTGNNGKHRDWIVFQPNQVQPADNGNPFSLGRLGSIDKPRIQGYFADAHEGPALETAVRETGDLFSWGAGQVSSDPAGVAADASGPARLRGSALQEIASTAAKGPDLGLSHPKAREAVKRRIDKLLRELEGYAKGGKPVSILLEGMISRAIPAWNPVGAAINNEQDVFALNAAFRNPWFESVRLMAVDAAGKVVAARVHSVGFVSESAAHVGEMLGFLEEAKAENPDLALIVSHNHPGGNPNPSMADLKLQQRLENVAAQVGVQVLDHVITNGTKGYSLKNMHEFSMPAAMDVQWAAVERTTMPVMDKPELTESMGAVLRASNPKASWAVYLDTRLQVRAMNLLPDTPQEAARVVLRDMSTQGAENVVLYPGNHLQGMPWTRDVAGALVATGRRVIDSIYELPMGGSYGSARAAGLIAEEPAFSLSRQVMPTDYPATAHKVIATTNVGTLTKIFLQPGEKLVALDESKDKPMMVSPAYKAAKRGGDKRMAWDIAKHFTAGKRIAEYQQALAGKKPVFVAVQQRESERMNLLPLAAAHAIQKGIGFGRVADDVWQIKQGGNTGVTADERGSKEHSFEGVLKLEPGETVVLVDDTFTSGSTLTALFDYLHGQGITSEHIFTMASGRYTKDVAATPEKQKAALDKMGVDAASFERATGTPINAFTGAELHGYTLNGKPGIAGFLARFDATGISGGSRVFRGPDAGGLSQETFGFSLSPASAAGMLSGDAVSRIRDPERRAKAMSRIARNFEALRLQLERLELLAGSKRMRKSLAKEAAMREAMRAEELENEAYAKHWQVLEGEDLTKIKAQPVHAILASPDSPLHGRLMSRSAAIKKHPDLFQIHRAGDYDGSEGVGRSNFGGQLMPDQAAQEIFDNYPGLLRAPTPDALWDALLAEQRLVDSMKEREAEAKQAIRDARAQAKRETNEWLKTQSESQADAYSPKQETLRALASLDAVLAVLPAEIRGRIGGYTQIARLGSEEARLDYLRAKLEVADTYLERWLRSEFGREFEALLKRTRPEKDEAGQKPRGKIGATVHDLFRSVQRAMSMTSAEVEAEALGLESLAASGDYTAEENSHMILEANLIRLAGDWTRADAARREAALTEARRIYETGYLEDRIKRSRQREARNNSRDALRKATKKAGTREERRARMNRDEGTRIGRAGKILLNLLSFEQVLQWTFGEGSAEANRLADWERAASSAKEDAVQAKLDAIEALFDFISGGRLKGEQLRWKMSQPNAIRIDGQSFSELEAISATLMWRQEDGRRHMEGHLDDQGNPVGEWHYSQEFMDALEDALSPEAKALRLHLGEQYAAEYERINKVFTDLYGVSMPRHKHYSPLTVKPAQAAGGQTLDPVTGTAMSAGITPGSLRNRSTTAIAEPDFKDALQTYIAHLKQMEHFIHYAPMATEAMALLNTRDLGNSVEAAAGKEALSTLRSWIDHFAAGGSRDAQAHLALNGLLNRVMGRAASMALVGRVSVLVIQSTQLGAALAEMPLSSYTVRLAKLFTGQLNWGPAMRSEYIQRRIQQMPPVVQQALEGLRSTRPNRLKHTVQKLGQLISGADGLFTAGTYAMVYDYQLGQAAKLGLTGADAESFARNAAERSVDRVAQPTRAGARSLYEVTATNPAIRLAWAFASEPRQKAALSIYALANRPAGAKARALAVTWLAGGVMASVIRATMRDLRDSDDDEIFDEKNWDLKRLALSSLTGPIQGVPMLGDAVEAMVFSAFGEYLPSGNMLSNAEKAAGSVGNVGKWFTGERELDDALKDAEAILSGVGLVSENAAAATSLMHVLRDAYGIIDNLTD